jgi:hypothetical protein
VRDGVEKPAAVIGAFWTLGAVPVVVVDAIAVPDWEEEKEERVQRWEEYLVVMNEDVPVKDVEAVDGHDFLL